MKKILRPKHLPILVTLSGLLGFVLRLWTFGSGTDAEGLYAPQPIAWALLWAITAVTLLTVVLVAFPLKKAGSYKFNFPRSTIGAIGNALAALGMMISGVDTMVESATLLSSITGILGMVAAVCLLLAAFSRRSGRKSAVFLHAIPCVYLALRVFDCSRSWSNEPQIGIFLFPFLASVCVMLAAYHRACFDVDMGKRRAYLFWSLTAVYFCMIALASNENLIFYGTMAIWLLTNLCNFRVLHKRKPEENTEDPGQTAVPEDAFDDDDDAFPHRSPTAVLSMDELKQILDK